MEAGSVVLEALHSSAPARALPMLAIGLSSAQIGVGGTVTATVTGEEIPVGTDLDGLFGFGFAITFTATGSRPAPRRSTRSGRGTQAISVATGRVGATANLVGQTSGPSRIRSMLANIVFTGLVAGSYQLQLRP